MKNTKREEAADRAELKKLEKVARKVLALGMIGVDLNPHFFARLAALRGRLAVPVAPVELVCSQDGGFVTVAEAQARTDAFWAACMREAIADRPARTQRSAYTSAVNA